MARDITGVNELIDSIAAPPGGPGQRTLQHNEQLYGMQNPVWGGQGSIEAGDAGSRLGIEMGMPSSKAASLKDSLLYGEREALEKLAFLGLLGKGIGAAARGVGAVTKGMHNFGVDRRAASAIKRTAGRAAVTEARAGRSAANLSKLEGLAPGARRMESAKFQGKELARGLGGGALATGGAAMTAQDLTSRARQFNGTHRMGYGQ